jgi:hypothetical protein
MNALKSAANSGNRIEKTQKQSWIAYVRKNKVPEGAMRKHAELMGVGGRLDPVIINDDGAWEGYYVYSKDDQFCVKFDVRED